MHVNMMKFERNMTCIGKTKQVLVMRMVCRLCPKVFCMIKKKLNGKVDLC